MTTVNPETILFLKNLYSNNNREWFNENKDKYLIAQSNMIQFADQLLSEMNKHDVLENESGKKSLYRIYNDVRFSKDKTPYNARFSCGLKRAGKWRRGGYYLQISPGDHFLACGFFAPNKVDLTRIRQDIDVNTEEWAKILNNKEIRIHFGDLKGTKVPTTPRSYSKDHPAIELLRHKQFFLRHDFKEAEVLSVHFIQNVDHIFRAVRPFFDYMSIVLTTNSNGESIV